MKEGGVSKRKKKKEKSIPFLHRARPPPPRLDHRVCATEDVKLKPCSRKRSAGIVRGVSEDSFFFFFVSRPKPPRERRSKKRRKKRRKKNILAPSVLESSQPPRREKPASLKRAGVALVRFSKKSPLLTDLRLFPRPLPLLSSVNLSKKSKKKNCPLPPLLHQEEPQAPRARSPSSSPPSSSAPSSWQPLSGASVPPASGRGCRRGGGSRSPKKTPRLFLLLLPLLLPLLLLRRSRRRL